jgi:monothiol glutaredoxin
LRNGGIDPEEMIQHLQAAHAHDQALLLTPEQVRDLMQESPAPLLLDCRTREEHDAVRIEPSEFLTQAFQQKLFARDPDQAVILYDHQGKNALDTCAWFLGHGMKNTRVLQGGIDAWSRDIDHSLPRYQLELEA